MREIRDTKRIVARVCKGTDLYMLAIYLSQLAIMVGMSVGRMLLRILLPDFPDMDAYDFLDGLAAVSEVIFGCVLLFLYAATQRDRGVLFEVDTPLRTQILGKRRKISATSLIFLVALIFVVQMFSGFLLDLLEGMLNVFGFTIQNSPAMNADYSLSVTLMLYAVIVGPFTEELVFRGFILRGLEPCGKKYAIVVSALLFCLMHGDIQQTLFTFLAGLILGYAASEYSIWVSYLLHVFNNGLLSWLLELMDEHLPENVAVILLLLLIIACCIVLVRHVREHREGILAYLQEKSTAPGAVSGLCNRWFLAYAAFCITETVLTVSPV